jgi:hypothetical protein
MPFAVLLVGAILVIVAFNNSAPALVSELEADIPPYFKWAAAIAAILGLGYIPGLRTPSRYLLGLVLLVVLLKNYTGIVAGFKTFLTGSGTPSGVGAGSPNPSASYVSQNAPAAAGSTTTGSGIPGVPGISSNPFAGLPSSLGDFFKLPGLNFGSPIFGSGGSANPSTGSNFGLGN